MTTVAGFVFAAWLSAAAGDSITTYHAMNRGAQEVNPIMRTLGFGKPLGVGIASFTVAIPIGVYFSTRKGDKHNAGLVALGFVTVLKALVAWRNHTVAR